MANSVTVGRAQLVFILCLPLAVLLGYLLSDPLDTGNTLLVALMAGVLSIPLLMRGYHPALIFAWNAAITPTFLPGQPFLWVPLAFLGLGFAIVNRFISPDAKFVSIPAITKPLVFLGITVLVTALLHGGFGLRSFGSESYGGRNYIYIFAAIVGYFALVSQPIPLTKANFYVGLFFLTALTALIPNLVYLGGRSWYFLYYLFPPVYAVEQAMGDSALDPLIVRILGLSAVATALLCWLLARYGLRRVLSVRKPWPLLVFLTALTAGVFCGFRSILGIFMLTLTVQFFLEGMFRARAMLLGLACLLVAGIIIIPNTDKLPLVVQRSISFLPVPLSPVVEQSAGGSTLWRLEMWKELLPEVPKYLIKGKGFGLDPTDIAFAAKFNRSVIGYDLAITVGDYHSGPLSLIIPLGIWGVIGFVWFLASSLKYLYRKYRRGAPELQSINTFLLAYFITRLVSFLFVAGSFFSDLFVFTGLIGLSVSLNGAALPQPEEAKVEPEAEELAYQEHLASQRAR